MLVIRYHRMMALLQVCEPHLSDKFTLDEAYTTDIIQMLREVDRMEQLLLRIIYRIIFNNSDGTHIQRYNVLLQVS